MRSSTLCALTSALWASCALAQVPCSPGLDLTVSPAAPMVGDVITVTVTNNTGGVLWHTLGAPVGGAFAGGCGGTWIWGPNVIDVPVPLPPGASASIVWDQTDIIFGEQVPPGRYGFSSGMSDDQHQFVGCCVEVTIHAPCLTPPTNYGAASLGAGGFAPALAASNGPAFFGNDAFALTVANLRGGAAGALVVGAAPGLLAAPWGTFLIDANLPFFVVPFTASGALGVPGAGGVAIPAPIPDDPALIGLVAYAQALIVDGAAQSGIAHSAGLTIPICP
ncbi:MAG: hypothetical protein JNL94_04325 [Planctomycetes bacterium]|nr:hypothetical protein [Planctomycetota bacterium]